MNIMTVTDVAELIPTVKFNFILADRVDELVPGDIVKNVTFNESFFQGHFPEPVMPGVLIIEALAQAGSPLLKFRFFQRKLLT